jgi:hypothetical protein
VWKNEKLHITKWAKLFFHCTVFGFYFPNNVAWKNGKSHITKWAKLFFHCTVFGFYFPNTVPWKNGKSQFTKWAELFFRQRVFFCCRVGRSYFSASKFFSAGKFFSAASFFPQTNSIRVLFFSVVRKMAENPVGFLPHPNFCPIIK